jgi:flagellar motor switch protein FliM
MEPENPDLSSTLLMREATEHMQSLLSQIADREETAAEQKPGRSVHPYDFRNPIPLTANEMRKLRARHCDFVSSLAARLSIYLRLQVLLQVTGFEALQLKDFIAPSLDGQLSLYKIEPLRGTCLLELNSRLSLMLVDRLMGGRGQWAGASRDLTDVETALLDQVTQLIIAEWCGHWSDLQELRPSLLGHEQGRYLNTAAMDSQFIVLSVEARVDDCIEQLRIGFPYATIEPLARQLRQNLEEASKETIPLPVANPKWDSRFDEIRIPMKAEWPAIRLSARQLTRLKEGDLLEWDPELANKVRLRLADAVRFVGRLGTKNKNWAVELTEVLKPE